MASSKLYPSLPPELIEEILYKTPVTSLIRFKSTCKEWYDLITSKRFMYTHLDQSPERFIRSDNHERVHIVDPVTGILSVIPIPDVFREPTPIYTMVHCDGLLLCLCYDWRGLERKKGANLAVWNPVLRQIKWIEPSVQYKISDYYGFGYDNTSSSSSRDNYKILRFLGPLRFRKYYDSDPEWCEIYDFNSDSWRAPKTKCDWEWDIDMNCRGVSVKGNMYWIAGRDEEFILCFDFYMETFKIICFCPFLWSSRYLACFSGDRLSLLTQDEEEYNGSTEIKVWLTFV